MARDDAEEIERKLDESFEAVWLPLMAGIGRVASVWAKLEFHINEQIWDLANVDINCGACITAQLTTPVSRMRALISLVRFHGGNEKLIGSLNKFSARLDGLARRRNRIIHDPWGYDLIKDTYIRMEITADRKLIFESKEAQIDDLKRVFDDIIHAMTDFHQLVQEIMAGLPAWPRIQYWQSWEKRGDEVRSSPSSEPKAPPSPPQPSPVSPAYEVQLKRREYFPLWFWARQT